MADDPKNEREMAAEKMIHILNSGALNLAMAIGYRTGVLDAMDAFDTPQTASSISKEAGLNRRYLQEWLGIMATGGIVEVSQGEDGESRFYLPKIYGDLLTRRAGNSNLGVYTQEIPLLTTIAMEAVVQGFYTGNGISYEKYPRFHAFMSELANAKHEQVLTDKFLPSVDNGNVVRCLTDGIRVCDIGCAEGVALLIMARSFPRSQFVGIDVSSEAIQEAREAARRQGLTNVEFIVRDAATLKERTEFSGLFDYITAFDAIHDQTHPRETLAGIYHALAAGGSFSMVDIAARTSLRDNLDHPMGPFLYTVSLMHCMPVGYVNGGAGLGMMWGREMALDMLREAGFQQVEAVEMPHDPFNLHFYCRKTNV